MNYSLEEQERQFQKLQRDEIVIKIKSELDSTYNNAKVVGNQPNGTPAYDSDSIFKINALMKHMAEYIELTYPALKPDGNKRGL